MTCVRSAVSLAMAALALATAGIGSSTTASAAATAAAIAPWQPADSYPGRVQEDARQDRPVSFWGAGLPLKDVFASVEEQTGVHIGFFPPGDDNERICVNLYLNRDDPPTLRELMAQLSWVVDCSFGVEPGGAEKRYVLLSTSVQDTARQRVRQEWQTRGEEWRQEWEQHLREGREELAAKLPEVREALTMSRDQLIKRYRGKDDALLLALLEPRRRAMVELVLALPPEDLEAALGGGPRGLTRPWAEWSPEQRETIANLLNLGRDDWVAGLSSKALGEEDLSRRDDLPLSLTVQTRGGALTVGVRAENANWWEDMAPHGRSVLFGDIDERPNDVAALHEELGDPLAAEEQRALWERLSEQMRAEWQARREGNAATALVRQIDTYESVSQEMFEALSSFDLPYILDRPVALWQLQELAARKTGKSVVSDCFWQPARRTRWSYDLVYPDKPEVTGYLALSLAAASTVDESSLWGTADDDRAGWEWGDAGSFLRFRHVARDLWRASFLPAGVLSGIDAWLKPYAAPLLDSGKERGSARVTVDLRAAASVVRQLTDDQLARGGRILYGSPTDSEEAFLHALREDVLGDLGRASWSLRFLATLSDGQWDLLEGPGLREQDLTPEQKSLPFWSLPGPPGMEMPRPERVSLEQPNGERGEGDGRGRGGRRGGGGMGDPFELRADRTYTLRVTYPEMPDLRGGRGGRGRGRGRMGPGNPGFPLPRAITVPLARPKPLTDEELAVPPVDEDEGTAGDAAGE